MLDFGLTSHTRICAELGARLRTQRLVHPFSQEDLASRAGVSVGTIKNIERKGQASMESFVRVVRALGLVDELQALFLPRLTSIAQMERLEVAETITRAPRKTKAPK